MAGMSSNVNSRKYTFMIALSKQQLILNIELTIQILLNVVKFA